jgi:hypothetical protein
MVGRLRVGQQQMAEIARALALNARLIIMDEPPLVRGAPHPPQLSRRSKRFSSVSQAEPRRGREATFRLKFLPVLFLTADPGLAHLDAHQSIRIDLVGILFEDCQVGEFARFKRAELVGHSDLTGRVDGYRA